ncbi:MAG TPA: aldehyde dehydrogenase family protein [Acidimicrobiales bacterium]|nr:aldehyde dehydrogenase family protein [Acidimicrobiales bacterium]
MTYVRGAAAPTSGDQDRVALDTSVLDAALERVAANATAWAKVTARERARLLERVVADTVAVSEEWNDAACAAKGLDPKGPDGGEELFSGVGTFVRMAQALRQSMLDIAATGRPRFPGPVHHRPGERIAIQVMPGSVFERILYAGVTAEVWMEPGVTEDDVRATQAAAYRDPLAAAGVALVLGAGNVASLGPRDVLSKLFADGKVVVLKANPVNDYLVPYWERAMAALIEGGFLAIVSGGAEIGAYLTSHDLVEEIHVTGSDKTHDAIVFGTGEEGARRKSSRDPLITKPVTCELGNVSPVVIVPGQWSDAEISYQAAHVATMLVNNAGFNCLSPRVLITHAGWAQREAFLAALEATFAAIPTRRAYYPGARARWESFVAAHPDAHQIGDATDENLPWTLVRDVDASDPTHMCLNVEAFCSLTSETALAADSPAQFVERAVAFCNDVVWGSLSMTILADPRTLADPVTGPAIERAVADLRYGSIGVNLWHAMSFAFSTTTWGAYPGHDITDIQSGTGFVGNAYLFAHPQKSVVRGPFVSRPAPPWFATNAHGGTVMRKLLAFEAHPSWSRLPGLLAAAMRR